MEYVPQPVPSAAVPELRGWLDTEHRRIAQTLRDARDALTVITAAIGDLQGSLLPYSASGNRWGVMPFVESDGVMEVGGYIDFHTSDADTGDYAVRLSASSNLLSLGAADFNARRLRLDVSDLHFRLYETDAADTADYALIQVDANQLGLFGWDNSAGVYRAYMLGTISTGAIGFYGSSGAVKQTVTGSRAGNAALASLLTALATLGLITDGSS